ncbi:MAG TPA: hypothetical protein VNZ94_06950 [Xanthobacteraceae bacterium]|nr:hypothetical protein [Xanthobacteraceae bacterium]
MLVIPALWNGYALLQYDTGGYLARWYEGYLVPSRSTAYGLYLHFGEFSHFWLTLGVQAFAVLWLLQATLRIFGIARPLQVGAIAAALCATTALPVLTSMLLTDIFAGLSVLSLFLVVCHGRAFGLVEKLCLIVFTAFSAASHSATLGVLFGLVCAGVVLRPWLGARLPLRGLLDGALALVLGAAMLVAANFALSGKVAWTPGGSAIAFGRMLQDGLVARYLNEHCDREPLKLCPYRNELPPTGDDFLWGKSMFNELGRFEGLGEEMAHIMWRSLAAYPGQQAAAALRATGTQLVSVATGEGSHNWLAHTWGIFETYLPQELPAMRAARQQRYEFDFGTMNRIHVPVALLSMAALGGILALAVWRRRLDELTLFVGMVTLALLGNAFLCGGLSGPHDRYGARMVWLAVFAVLIAAALYVEHGAIGEPDDHPSPTA